MEDETHTTEDETQPLIHESHITSPPWRLDSREDREEKKKQKEVREKEREERLDRSDEDEEGRESLKWRGDETMKRERGRYSFSRE